MNIERFSCDRLGYEYVDMFIRLLRFMKHYSYSINTIGIVREHDIEKFEELCEKLEKKEIDIIEFHETTRLPIDYKDKEIERLNNELQDFKVQDISNQEQLYNLIEENERLNNIINELEKDMNNYYEEYKDVDDIVISENARVIKIYLDKLKELKENK